MVPGTPLLFVKGFLPVAESFGYVQALRLSTQGMAFPQSTFSHYELVPGSITEDTSRAG